MARLASRSSIIYPRALRATSSNFSFHTTAFSRQEEKKEASSITLPTAAADWKTLAPVGLALAIPMTTGMYVFNEESQLACCFILFCSSVYKYGGDMIGSFFDAKAEALLKEHNALEDANIKGAQEALDAHKAQLNLVGDMDILLNTHKDMVHTLCEVESNKLKHATREKFIRNLDALVRYENEFNASMQGEIVSYVTQRVRNEINASKAQVQNDSFKHAVSILSNVGASSKTTKKSNKPDAIVQLFCKYIQEYTAVKEKEKGTVKELSKAEQDDLQAYLDQYISRHAFSGVKLTAPSSVTL
jgi:hypothetical protein